jgi:phosphoglycolate phosphatase-like HAD superfamily hydrolase
LKLLLFDIDGTLIRSAGAGKQSMELAFEKVYGISNGFETIQMMGRTDPSIFREAITNHGLEWEVGALDQFQKFYFEILKREIQRSRPGKRICPGILKLLQYLQDQSNVILGLLTGNWQTSAVIKLQYFDIDHFFQLGAYGDDSEYREELVPVAMEHFFRQTGQSIAKENVVVIGDTPLDIQCAKPHGVRTIGVATGFHTFEDLREAGAGAVFEDLTHTDSVLKTLGLD